MLINLLCRRAIMRENWKKTKEKFIKAYEIIATESNVTLFTFAK